MEKFIKQLKKYPSGYWDFKGVTKQGIHNIGKYPATMVPEMQKELLSLIANEFKDKNITLLDPFCGSGTTLVIANNLGINSLGIDINPYAVLLTSIKTKIYNYDEVLSSIKTIEKRLKDPLIVPDHYFFNIDKWFKKDIISSLSKIRYLITLEKNKDIRDFFWIVFSETIFKFSNDRTSTFKLHALPKDEIERIIDNTYEYFFTKLKEKSLFLNYKTTNKAKVMYGDCKEVLKDIGNKKFEIICTSPPYGDNQTTVTYGQASILYLKWIDSKDLKCHSDILKSFSTIDKISVGGSKKKPLNTLNLQLLNEYLNKISLSKRSKVINFFEDYFIALEVLKNCLKENGYLIMTVGNRRIDSFLQPLDEITIEICKNLGLETVSKFSRNIIYNKNVKSISEEMVLIFKKH